MSDDFEVQKSSREVYMDETERSDNCVQCGECEEKCPQGIEIMEWMQKITEMFT